MTETQTIIGDKEKTIRTDRYIIGFREVNAGGPAGYESVYLTEEGDSADSELYSLLDNFKDVSLVSSNRMIRQRNGSELVNALMEGRDVGVASGFKPSGAYHFGHSLPSSTVAYMQKNGVRVFMPIADVECDMDTEMSREDYLYWAADNLLDWGASGVNLDAAHVYLQSEERRVNDLAYLALFELNTLFN